MHKKFKIKRKTYDIKALIQLIQFNKNNIYYSINGKSHYSIIGNSLSLKISTKK